MNLFNVFIYVAGSLLGLIIILLLLGILFFFVYSFFNELFEIDIAERLKTRFKKSEVDELFED
jgi:hypothetical protein